MRTTSSFAVRDLLEQAAAFERAGDPSGAAARARFALAQATDEESRDEARFALARFEANERAWRDEIRARARAFSVRERADARVADDEVSEVSPRKGSSIARTWSPRRERRPRIAFA